MIKKARLIIIWIKELRLSNQFKKIHIYSTVSLAKIKICISNTNGFKIVT